MYLASHELTSLLLHQTWTSAGKRPRAALRAWTTTGGSQRPSAGASGFWPSSCSAWTRSWNSGLMSPNTWWPEAERASKRQHRGAVGAGRLTKHFKHLLRNTKRKGTHLQPKKARSKQGSCRGFTLSGRLELPAKVWGRQVPASHHRCATVQNPPLFPEPSRACCAHSSRRRGWGTSYQPIAHYLETTWSMVFGSDTESGHIKLFSGASTLPEPLLSYRPGYISKWR